MSSRVQEAALKLVQVYDQYQLEGTFAAMNPEQLVTLQEKLDLSPALMEWYSMASPSGVIIPTIGDGIQLFGAEDLTDALLGYRYDGINGSEIADWDPTCLVIAGQDQFPAVARTASANDTAIYLATPSATGPGWKLEPLSLNLEGFLHGIVEYIKLFVGDYNSDLRISEDDDNIKPEFNEAFESALNNNPDTAGFGKNWLKWIGYI